MATIPLGPLLPVGSSHLPACIGRDTRSGKARRTPIWCCSGWRLPRFTSTRLPVFTRLCGPIPRLGHSYECLLRTAVSRHPTLWSPDLPLLHAGSSGRPVHFVAFDHNGFGGGCIPLSFLVLAIIVI
jgi:hypothetical protein